MRVTRLAVTLALAAAPCAWADDIAVSQLRGMSLADLLEVDISTGTSKFVRDAPAIAYVITADDIARMGARNVLEVLQAVPGLNTHLYQSSVTNSPLLDMRGLFTQSGGHELFMRDGHPLRSFANFTLPEIFKLPIQFIERIEIARGPGSSVYGADALVGTINIITRKKPAEVGAFAGNPHQHAEWGGFNGTTANIDWALAVTHTSYRDEAVTRSYVPVPRNFTQDWRHEYSDVDLKLRAGPFSIGAWALNYYKNETGNPANARGFTKVGTEHRIFDLNYDEAWGQSTRVAALVMYTRFRGQRFNEIFPTGLQNGKNADVRDTYDFSVTDTRFEGHRLRLNFGLLRDQHIELDPPPPGAPQTTPFRYDRYIGLQDEWRFARDWELTAGVRADCFSDFGTIKNPRAGLVWTVNQSLTAKFLSGEAFRAPNFGDTGPAGQNPERMRNNEIAIDYRPRENLGVVASVFRYRADNLADQQGPNTALVARDGDGVEVSVGWQPMAAWRFDLGLSYVDVRDRATGVRVASSAREIAKLSVTWVPATSWHIDARWEGYFDRARPAGNDPRPALEDFNIAHATVRYQLTPRATVEVAGHNLTNKRAWLPFVSLPPQDVQLTPRSVFAQLQYRF